MEYKHAKRQFESKLARDIKTIPKVVIHFIYLFIICTRPRRSITVKETTITTNPSTDERKLKTTDK